MDTRREVVSILMKMIPEDKFTIHFMPLLNVSGEEYLTEMLNRNSRRESFALHPLDGPNYDELSIMISSTHRPAYESLSRGQKRRLILYMIITAGKLIAMKLKREPVLLFDDLTAELDSDGRDFAFKELSKTKWQVFITAPENPFRTRKKIGVINLPY
jgi:recombinational DNA repair ATPase RecF